MQSEEYVENMCQAIDIIVKKAISNLPFNITLTCYVEKEIEAGQKYLVKSLNETFKALSNGTKYEKGDKVYVLIPNNDYTKTKMIIGKI